jgi:hypothetical protein
MAEDERDKKSELALLARGLVFVHAHGGFAEDCNPHCGHYNIGKQVTTYDPAQKKFVPVKDKVTTI